MIAISVQYLRREIMTAQINDWLTHKGETRRLFTLPLENYLATGNNKSVLAGIHRHTACLRGYSATWAIHDSMLYLTGISGYWDAALDTPTQQHFVPPGQELRLQHIFPNAKQPIVANWFSGQLRCPVGKLLRRVHLDFASLYECDLLIEIHNGQVISESERTNSVPLPIDEDEIDIPQFLRRTE